MKPTAGAWSPLNTLARQVGEELAASRGRIKAHPNEVAIVERHLRAAFDEGHAAGAAQQRETDAARERDRLADVTQAERAVADANNEIERLHHVTDGLLAHCPDGECSTCARIVCPHGDPFHFHHDGCPACAGDDPVDEEHQAACYDAAELIRQQEARG